MSARRAASLDASLLARKGDAAPAIAEDPVPPAAHHPASSPALVEAAAPSGTRGGDRPLHGRFAPLTAGRRGLAVLAAAACLVAVAVIAQQLWEPTDGAPATPVASPASGAPLSDGVATDPPAETAAAPGEVQPPPPPPAITAAAGPPAPEPALSAAAAPSAPSATAPPATAAEPALVAAVVSDGPPPPPRPEKKPVRKSAAAAPAPVASGPYSLQLAAFSHAESAHREAVRLQKRLDPVLAGRKVAVITATNAANKPVYRLRASAYRSLAAARDACNRIRKLKSACLVIRR